MKRLKIDIVRPSINKCFPEFKSINNKIYYGLGAIKNVGFEAISNIIKERDKNGKFQSINDFIQRVDTKDVNKLQLEGLTKAGVFDEFDADRGKILKSIPKMLQQIKNVNEDKKNNQSSLFDYKQITGRNFEFLPSARWKQKELLNEEFKALGFYISDHPLSEYENIFKELKIIPYNQFKNTNEKEGLVAGTIMSIQEKKSNKGTPYAIVKFSDQKEEFELFLFAEMLTNNRDKLKESESFILTLQKDIIASDAIRKRINIKKIISLEEMINKPYSKVTIELNKNFKIDELRDLLGKKGDTQINLIITENNKKAHFSFQNNRKFDLKNLKTLKAKEYVRKITL